MGGRNMGGVYEFTGSGTGSGVGLGTPTSFFTTANMEGDASCSITSAGGKVRDVPVPSDPATAARSTQLLPQASGDVPV